LTDNNYSYVRGAAHNDPVTVLCHPVFKLS